MMTIIVKAHPEQTCPNWVLKTGGGIPHKLKVCFPHRAISPEEVPPCDDYAAYSPSYSCYFRVWNLNISCASTGPSAMATASPAGGQFVAVLCCRV